MRAAGVAVLLLVLFLSAMVVEGAAPAGGATPFQVKSTFKHCVTAGTCTLSESFTKTVASDTILVLYDFHVYTAGTTYTTPAAPSDNESNTYTLLSSSTQVVCITSYICGTSAYYATSSTAHGVSISIAASGTGTTDILLGIAVYDIAGGAAASAIASSASGTSGCCSVSSISAPAGSFVVGIGLSTTAPTASAAYQYSNPGDGYSTTEYQNSYAGGGNTVPFTTATGDWMETAVVLPTSNPGVSCPMTFSAIASWAELCYSFPNSGAITLNNQTASRGSLTATGTCEINVASSGDLIVMTALVSNSGFPAISAIADTFGSSFTRSTLDPGVVAGGHLSVMALAYASSASSGLDTLTMTTAAGAYFSVECFDFTGASTSGVTSASGVGGTGTTLATNTITTSAGYLLLAFGTTYSYLQTIGGGFSAGTGFSISAAGTIFANNAGSGGTFTAMGIEYQPYALTTTQTNCLSNGVNYGSGSTVIATTNEHSGDALVTMIELSNTASNTINTVTGVTGGPTWSALGTGSSHQTGSETEAVYAYGATAAATGSLSVTVTPALSGGSYIAGVQVYDIAGGLLTGITESTGSSGSSGSTAHVTSFAAANHIVIAGISTLGPTGVWVAGPNGGGSYYYLPTNQFQIDYPPAAYYNAAECGTAPGSTTAPIGNFNQAGASMTSYAEYAISMDPVPPNVYVTIETSPADLKNSLTIQSVNYLDNPIVFSVTNGTTLTLAAASSALKMPGFLSYSFSYWSQGGAQDQTYTALRNVTLIAYYVDGGSSFCSTYSGSGANALEQQLNHGCEWSVVFYSWFGLFGPWILAFIDFLPALAIYLRTENPGAAIGVYVLIDVVLVYGMTVASLPASINTVAPGLLGAVIAGGIFQLLRSGKGG